MWAVACAEEGGGFGEDVVLFSVSEIEGEGWWWDGQVLTDSLSPLLGAMAIAVSRTGKRCTRAVGCRGT